MAVEGRLQGKRAVVTGAGTGIGRGIALEFAREGAQVVLHYAHSATGAESAVEEIRRIGGRAVALHADLQDIDAIGRLADEAQTFLGGVDLLVNNAGITMNKPFFETTPEQFDTLYGVNIRGMFFLTQHLARGMVERRSGAVVNLSSVHASTGMTEHTVYAGTKAAIVAFTRVLALELSPAGVRVNAIAPGWVLVENHIKVLGDFDQQTAGKTIPAGFIGAASDIGRVAVFLASEESRYLIGQTLIVDGGQTAIMPLSGDFKEKRKEQWGQGYVKV
ncbi:MAG: 3-oxoacyl-ACP reductase FabG [candidate division Zixibacteria bacterium]|nr:3-oxoacyl-ACP reductase FabG [candidate division Zixibacteria bacterium]